MKDNPPWLFLEPYVHMVYKGSDLLLYNTLSKTVLEFTVSNKLAKIVSALLDPGNGYVIRLPASQLRDTEILEFITRLRQYFMGDLLDPAWSDGRPVNLFPEPSVKFGFNPPIPQQSLMKPALDLRNYLQEITFFLNSGSVESENRLKTACRQFSYPVYMSENEEEMDIDLFRTVISEVNNYTPALIHISGKNLINYPHLEEVTGILASSPFQKKYHLRIENWDKRIIPYILVQKQTTLSLYVSFPVNPDTIAGYLHRLPDQRLLKRCEFNFVVTDQEELQMALEITRILDLSNVFFKPFYTGENMDFFRENVFVSREEILASQPDQQQVFSRISINENDFGKLWVVPGGEVYANLNDPEIGEATTSSLVQLVSHELKNGISWRRIRNQVSPCKKCIYQFLCPPVSSYEISMNRFNFCDVYQNGEES